MRTSIRAGLIGLMAGWAFSSASLKADELTAALFDDTVVHDIRVDMSPDDWATLKLHYLDDTYYHATLSWNSLSQDVGIRSRGRGSRSPDKPNFDLNINKYVKGQIFAGVQFFILKANNQDASLLHETVAFKLFQKMGLPAPREAPARVYINGDYFGFYTIVEHEDEDFLDRNFGESTGDLYEWKPNETYHFEYLGDDPTLYSPILLDPKTDNPDAQKFVDFVKAVNFTSDTDFVPAISQYIDPKLYLTHAAIEMVLGELDGILGDTYGVNNIYIYRFSGQTLFQMIAWDKDLTFREPERELLLGINDDVLARRLMAIPEYRDTYYAAVAKAARLLGGTGGWADQEITREYQLIHADAINDPHKQCIADTGAITACGPQDFETGVQQMHSFVATRTAFVNQSLTGLGFSLTSAPPAGTPSIATASELSPSGSDQLLPGSVIHVTGLNFSSDTHSEAGPFPRVENGSYIAVNGVRAPILSLSSSDAEIQLPWDLQPGKANIVAVSNKLLSEPKEVNVVAAAPEILAVVHSDGTAVNAERPSSAGEVIAIYAIGLGPVDANLLPGAAAPLNRLVSTKATPAVQTGAVAGRVIFSGLAPGFLGLYQVNVTVPAGASTPITVTIGGHSTQAPFAVP